ncbi:MAG TPA: protein kinase [Thermoanaerobaculia bacterium]|nr:protein kinase [Thermoanaerobaculia bacterium]
MSEVPEYRNYGEYEIESFLGKGSIGKVWLARHRRIGRRVALKTVHLSQKFEDDTEAHEFYRRLQREAELCAAIQHPNVVTLYDVGYDGEVVSYFATEYIDGEPLLARLRRTRPLPLKEALTIAADILRGLAYAHAKGIIHRDIKPANILLTSEGQAKIADFGVARPLNSSLTATRSLVGTPNYMSPEQVKTAPVSPRSDLFSAGVVMYEMLTGVKPFAAPELSGILYNVVNHRPPAVNDVNPAVPEAVSQVVEGLLEKKPDDRYASAADALADLEAVLREPVTAGVLNAETMAVTPHDSTSPLATVIEPRKPSLLRRRVPALLFWLLPLLLASAVGAAVYTLRNEARSQQPLAMITAEQRQIHDTKVRALQVARGYAEAGRYQDAVAAYDALLARHPESLVAREERAVSQRLLEEAMPKAEVTKTARKMRRTEPEPEKPAEPPKKPGRWERVKRWFRG